MNQNFRQLLVSFALSCSVFFCLSYFWGDKKEEVEGKANVTVEDKKTLPIAKDVLNIQERIFFKTGQVSGSINKFGCKLDVLQLQAYKQNIDSNKPLHLLHPEFGGQDFFSSMLFQGDDVPTKSTLWEAQGGAYVFENKTWHMKQKIEFNGYRVSWNVMVKNIASTPKKLACSPSIERVVPETLGSMGYEGSFLANRTGIKKASYDNLQQGKSVVRESYSGWMGITERYWLAAVSLENEKGSLNGFGKRVICEKIGLIEEVQPGEQKTYSAQFFFGPKDISLLEFEQGGAGGLDRAIDYGWLPFLTKPLFYLMRGLKHYCGSMALALVVFILLTKLFFLPLTVRSHRSMKMMKQLQPHVKVLQDQYKDSPKVLQLRLLELYKANKVNPLSGCLPVALQIILFFPIYRVLNLLIDMRHAPFYGWIKDLAAPDPTSWSNLFGLLPWEKLGYLDFGLWPVLMGVSFLIQQYDANNKQLSIMLFIGSMVMSTSMPVCVTIFWTLSNLFALAQGWIPTKLKARSS